MTLPENRLIKYAIGTLFLFLLLVTGQLFFDDVEIRQQAIADHTAVNNITIANETDTNNSVPLGLKLAKGFTATLYADDNLATDIHSLTIDSLGRVVVSGPGYVRILIDSNNDGKADQFKQFANGPGAQGMFFHGRDLLYSGGTGLLRYRDRNGDDRADGRPDVLLKAAGGGEHRTHAIRKGPDGWWYAIAGNYAKINHNYVTLKTSPVRKPGGGVVMRLKPDFSGGEVFSNGFRNGYDFDFNPNGDLFVFDSDMEYDVTLPWYRPTRLFHSLPGSHAGWVSENWKRPGTHFDMPPIVQSFGRGSPTGVVCYRHRQFPKPYHNAMFILDWTFGKIFAVPLQRNGSSWKSKPILFAETEGTFGFAPTDIAVGIDGSLYVSVGGRGTRGGVYKITADKTVAGKIIAGKNGADKNVARKKHLVTSYDAAYRQPKTAAEKELFDCLDVLQPLSSWARNLWVPIAKNLGAKPFLAAVLDETLEADRRVRAIEIMTERFGGLPISALKKLAISKAVSVRARAVWSHGRISGAAPNVSVTIPFLNDAVASVRRSAVETFLGIGATTNVVGLLPVLTKRLADRDLNVRRSASQIVARLSVADVATLGKMVQKHSLQAWLAYHIGRLAGQGKLDVTTANRAAKTLEKKYAPSLQLETIRLLQLALGCVGLGKKRGDVFQSYGSRVNLKPHERSLDPLRIQLAKIFPTKNELVDIELARVIAMLSPLNPNLLDSLLAKITATSHPTRDLHYLFTAARLPVKRTAKQRQNIANAFLSLDVKVAKRRLKQDVNWESRVMKLYQAHADIDPDLPAQIAQHPTFGSPEHIVYMSRLTAQHWQKATDLIAKKVSGDADVAWSNDVIFLLGESPRPEHRKLVRAQYENFAVRSAVIVVLSKKPEQQDRAKFFIGLESSQFEVQIAAASGLEKLPASKSVDDLFGLYAAVRRFRQGTGGNIKVRNKLISLLRRSTGKNFGFPLQKPDNATYQAALKKWADWLTLQYPKQAAVKFANKNKETATVLKMFAKVNWATGDVARGKVLYEKRTCSQCHNGRRALGPNLAGATGRFSRDDLFTAILEPNRDVSPRYQTTLIQTKQGKVYMGRIIFKAADSITLRNSTNQTIRINGDDIENRRTSHKSLMPEGLLKGLKPKDFADLYAYLRSLSKRR